MVFSLEGMSGIFDTFQKLELNSSWQPNAALGEIEGGCNINFGEKKLISKYPNNLQSFWFNILPDPYRSRLKLIKNIHPIVQKLLEPVKRSLSITVTGVLHLVTGSL